MSSPKRHVFISLLFILKYFQFISNFKAWWDEGYQIKVIKMIVWIRKFLLLIRPREVSNFGEKLESCQNTQRSFLLNLRKLKDLKSFLLHDIVWIFATVEELNSYKGFVSNLLHSFYCFEYNFTVTVTLYFHENFMVDDKLQDRKLLSAYNRVLCICNSCWSS